MARTHCENPAVLCWCTGGDNSDRALGIFYEGAMTAGYASAATDDAIQANIVAAGYKLLRN